MGACEYINPVRKTEQTNTAKKAFISAVEGAAYEHGHGGYTGTIAEKHDFKIVKTVRVNKDDFNINNPDQYLDWDNGIANDKWGPSACVEIVDEKTGEVLGWVFYGWASS